MTTPPLSVSRLVLVLGALSALGPLSVDMYLPSFPRIAREFAAPLSAVQLSLSSYFVGLALGQVLYGPFTDRFGRKPPLQIGLAVYLAASIACAVSPSIPGLVSFRFIQALGACAGAVVTRAVIRDLYPPRESARIFSLLMLVMGAAPILAPLAGGFVAHSLGWRAIFWVQAASAAACSTAIAWHLPESRGPDPSVRFSRAFHVYAEILRDRRFVGYALAGGLAQSGMFAYITGSPFVFIEMFGIPAERYGWVFGANAFGLIAASQLNARFLRGRGIDAILAPVFAALAASGGALACSAWSNLGFAWIALPLFAFVSLLGLTFPNTSAGALVNQQGRAGSASALLGTLQFSLAATASACVSGLHDGTARPMGMVVAACGALSCLFYRLLALPASRAGVSDPA